MWKMICGVADKPLPRPIGHPTREVATHDRRSLNKQL
jgi:hypothetical protein